MSFDPIRLKKLWDNLKASEGKDNEDAHFNKWQMAWNDAFPAIVSEIETLRKWNEGNKILSESYRKKNDELTILSREAEAGKRLAEAVELVKDYSCELPISIERQGGLYAQGMHAGIDLSIDTLHAALATYREQTK